MLPKQHKLFQDKESTSIHPAALADGRDVLDRYYSAPYWVDLLLDELKVTQPLHMLEPFAGRDLSLARRMMQFGHYVDTADIDDGAPVLRHCNSFVEDWSIYDAVITNPPFTVKDDTNIKRKASDAVRLFVPRVRCFAAFLMRLSFLEPCDDRADILTTYPPDKVLVLPRYSFKKTENSNTDLMTCAWFVWMYQAIKQAPTYRVVSRDELERYQLAYLMDQKRRAVAAR